MDKIIFFKKTRKIIAYISIFVIMIFTSISMLTTNTVFAKNSIPVKNTKSTEFTVFVSNDGLYTSEVKENNQTLLDKNNKINLPIISKDGLYVAYTKEDNLYICSIETNEITEVEKNIESYNWNNSGELIYSVEDGGLSIYNTRAKSSTKLINNEYNYYNINCDSKNKIYANKDLKYTEGNNQYIKSIGIISYDLDSKEEKILLEGKKGTDKEIGEQSTYSELLESIGSRPTVLKISSDDRYMYIWNKPNSGSMSADMTEFAVYDILNNKLIENNNMIALAYKDNISQNPIDSKLIAVNNGEGREMYYNKTLGIYNAQSNTFTSLIPESQVSMMPDYSKDGKNIVYSGTNSLDGKELNTVKEWFEQPHYIYEVNADTKKITQITNSKACDFMPKYLLDNEILFVREEGNSYSLWKTKDGVETKIADSLNFNSESYTNSWYYGHYETENVIDVYTLKK